MNDKKTLERKLADLQDKAVRYHDVEDLHIVIAEYNELSIRTAKLLREMNDYLHSGNKDTAIYQGSIFHQQVESILADES